MSEPLDEVKKIVDDEVARIREAINVVMDADPQLLEALRADMEAERFAMVARVTRLAWIKHQLEKAALEREDVSPTSGTAA